MKIITYTMTVAGAVLLASAAGARAGAGDWTDNLYFNAEGGVMFQQDADFSQSGAPTMSASFNPGIRIDLAAGYKLNQSFALEIEPGFMWNTVDNLNGHGLGPGTSIDVNSVPVLASLIYTFPTTHDFTPYVGLGVGENVGFFVGTIHNNSSF